MQEWCVDNSTTPLLVSKGMWMMLWGNAHCFHFYKLRCDCTNWCILWCRIGANLLGWGRLFWERGQPPYLCVFTRGLTQLCTWRGCRCSLYRLGNVLLECNYVGLIVICDSSIVIQFPVIMVTLDWLGQALLMRVEWSSVRTRHGEQFVMTFGIPSMQWWPADNSDIQLKVTHHYNHTIHMKCVDECNGSACNVSQAKPYLGVWC